MSDDKSNEIEPASALSNLIAFPILFVFAFWCSCLVLGYLTGKPPAPVKAADAGEFEFSAERADPILKTLVGDGIPHPAGSEQNKVVRQRIIDMLNGWGYEVVQQETSSAIVWAKNAGEEVPLVNLMTRLKGSANGPAVMLSAHYDSRTGPGASDDGVGLSALLEIARMMKQKPQARNDIIFLITDGEELGLLGAKKWVEEHSWAKDVDSVINLEARGTTGPSFMFETSEESRWLVELISKHVTHPFASSLYYEIYKILPNDTDFTVFKRAGIEGFNFAFIGDVKNYHTLNDNYENADRGSLQHHGQNAWSLLQPLSEYDLSNKAEGKSVYFSVLGKWLVSWPESWSLIASVVSTVILFVLAAFGFRNNEQAGWRHVPAAIGLGLLQFIAVVVVISAIGILAQQDQRFETSWLASPLPVVCGHWFAALSLVCLLSSWASRFASSGTAWVSVALLWALLAVASSVYVTGASYLVLVPVALSVIAGLAGGVFKQSQLLAPVVLACAAGFTWLPNEQLFYDAIGLGMIPFNAVRASLILTTLLPLLVVLPGSISRKLGWLFLAAFVVCAILAVVMNPLPAS